MARAGCWQPGRTESYWVNRHSLQTAVLLHTECIRNRTERASPESLCRPHREASLASFTRRVLSIAATDVLRLVLPCWIGLPPGDTCSSSARGAERRRYTCFRSETASATATQC